MFLVLTGTPVAVLIAFLGLKVLLRARRGGALPEVLVGVFFLCVSLGGWPGLMAGQADVIPPDIAPPLHAVGQFVMSIGFGALAVFAWRCFGPASRWRRNLACVFCGVFAVLWLGIGIVDGFQPGGSVIRLQALARGAMMLWAFCESLAGWRRMRRRLALELADPVVANRFLLWCGWTGGVLGATAVIVFSRFVLGGIDASTAESVRRAVVVVFLAMVLLGGASLHFAFFPPRWYVARLARLPAA